MLKQVPYLRVFVSSPGDVKDERKIALDAIDRTQYHPAFRGKFAFEVIAWDKEGAGTTLRATMSPQEAINKGLPRPSECDIVIVIFWARMGTPFNTDDGQQFLSGTHWELLDALDSTQAETYIFRRTEVPDIKPNDPERDAKNKQYDTVNAFIKSDLFYDPTTGEIRRSINFYATPDEFRNQLEKALAERVHELLSAGTPLPTAPSLPPSENVTHFVAADWEGSPFPGLRAFNEADTPIFFGRGRETDELVTLIEEQRFVAVVGASGSGKSSLVAAGLLPRLKDKNAAITRDWFYARMTPGTDPFGALADALMLAVPTLGTDDPIDYPDRLDKLTASLRQSDDRLSKTLHHALRDAPEWAEALLFVDQFEELFTLTPEDQRKPFVQMLTHPADNVRVIITMRADFYHRAVPFLEKQLREGNFALDKPDQFALLEMIERPAERAALQFDNGLPQRIVRDTGDEPGALALMAYALDELYQIAKTRGDRCITTADYEALGGVQGAIGKRAETTFNSLPGEVEDKADLLGAVFRELVSVDEKGMITRRRAIFNPATLNDDVYAMIAAFVDARLLTANEHGEMAAIEVSHEAILSTWERLSRWIEQYKDDLWLVRHFEREAQLWDSRNRPTHMHPSPEEIVEYELAIENLGATSMSPLMVTFLQSEIDRLLSLLEQVSLSHQERREIGKRLAILGDPRPGVGLRQDGLPDIQWCKVNGVHFAQAEPTFWIAQYPITHAQFQVFVYQGGYIETQWWKDLAHHVDTPRDAGFSITNHPRDTVSWYEAVAFCRWLSHRFKKDIQLPTETQWELTATNGQESNLYPWGSMWTGYEANTGNHLDSTTAVGMYPTGKAACGALDMCGNVEEWTLNLHHDGTFEFDSDKRRVLRGGSWSSDPTLAISRYRFRANPEFRNHNIGFRVVMVEQSDSFKQESSP